MENNDFKKLSLKLKQTSVYLIIFLVLGFIPFILSVIDVLKSDHSNPGNFMAYMLFAIFIANYSFVLRKCFLKIEKYTEFKTTDFKKEKIILILGYILSIPLAISLFSLVLR